MSTLESLLLGKLRARNLVEVDNIRDVVENYLALCKQKSELRDRVSNLEKRTKDLSQEKETLKVELLNKDDNEGKAQEAEKLKVRNEQLGEEILQSYKENARIAQVSYTPFV